MPIDTTKVETIRTKALDILETELDRYDLDSKELTGPVKTGPWADRISKMQHLVRWCNYRLGEENVDWSG